MSWFRDVRRGAAFELGRRLWRPFAAFEIIRWFARYVLPTLLIMASLGLAVWLAVRTAAWWMPRLLALAAIAGGLTVLIRLAYRYRWELRAGLPRTAVAAGVVAMAGLLGTVVYHLR